MNKDKATCHPKSDAKCDPCDAMFQENLHHLIDEAKPPRGAEHDARQRELDSAFGHGETTARSDAGGHPLGDMPKSGRP